MGMCGRCVPAPAGAVFAHRLQKAAVRRQQAALDLPSALCVLPSARARFGGYRPFGLLEPAARAWGWARARHKKGIWWMPWHREAMKDVARCEKPRGGASAR
jgi:hypothetical protein